MSVTHGSTDRQPCRTPYTETFRALAPGYDPRHIEAYVRLEYSTLGHLSRATLKREASIAMACVDADGREAAERCAQSFGL